MKKNINKFLFLIIMIVAVTVVILISKYIFDAAGRINQGNFRINDFVIKSTVDIKDTKTTKDDSTLNLSDMEINVSQNNTLFILVANTGSTDISEMYIDNITTKMPIKKGLMSISQSSKDTTYNLSNKVDKIPVEFVSKEDKQYLVEINVNNSNMLNNIKIPSGINSITYDGTIFNTLGVKFSDINFDIQFYLNIKDSSGKINKCKVKLNMPNNTLLINGISIIREDIGKFAFTVK